ncbi:iron chelate uptake ABC transporter family permease subunit [Arthrobacter ginkgonis]|uniref:Iron chelate uptake ABC transporter family permease subunit n=1 Tax=Arthrobacter ginkgonis TaxID=1630594 RepID=A0ABP7CHW1_9MICC
MRVLDSGPWRRALAWVLLGSLLLVLSAGALGLAPDPAQWWAVATGTADARTMFLVQELRGPRTAAAVLIGAALGMAGAVTQAVLRNVLASPDIIGVTAGAGLGAVASIVGAAGFPALLLLGPWRLPLAAGIGALAAGALVLLFAWRGGSGGGFTGTRLVLVGLGVNAGLGAAVSWLLLRAELPDLASALVWLTGSLNQATWDLLGPSAAVAAVAGAGCVVLGARWLPVLALGDELAAGLGLRVRPAVLALLGLAVVVAGAATAVAGPVGFVAFVAPQLALRLFRTAQEDPASAALTGAVLMLLADLVGKNLFPVVLPVGLVTSIAGAPFLVWVLLALSRRR